MKVLRPLFLIIALFSAMGSNKHFHERDKDSERNCYPSTCKRGNESVSCTVCIYTCSGCGTAFAGEKH